MADSGSNKNQSGIEATEAVTTKEAAAVVATTDTSGKANNKHISPAIATEPTSIVIQPLTAAVDAASSNSHNKKISSTTTDGTSAKAATKEKKTPSATNEAVVDSASNTHATFTKATKKNKGNSSCYH